MVWENMMKRSNWLAILMLACAVGLLLPAGAYAAAADACTDQPIYDMFGGGRLDSILQDIITLVATALDGVWVNLYEGIIASTNYQNAVFATLTLYLLFYATSFLFGFAQATFAQALMRIIKIGIIITVMSSLTEFNQTVVPFFECGTNWLIAQMISIGGGTALNWSGCPGDPGAPFALLEGIMRQVFSPKMFIITVGSLTTGPYGPVMAMALIWTVFNIFMMILKALEIYLLAMIIRTLLFGLAPVFFVFLLFDRTKHIFMGWVNQLVSFSLQPVFMFAFLAFFTVMLEGAITDITQSVDLCYTKMEHVGKSPYDIQHWRFKVDGGPYEGEWTWKGCVGCTNTAPFPISIYSILLVMILAYIGIKMSSVVTAIAADIAQSSMKLDQLPGTLNTWFNGLRGGGGHGMSTPIPRRTSNP